MNVRRRARSRQCVLAVEVVLMSGGLTVATSNPAFSKDLFPGYEQVYGVPQSTTMTVQGTVGKTFVLLAILMATAAWSWNAAAGQTACDRIARRRRDRRLHRGHDHDVQAHARTLDGADLCRARRGLAGAISQVVELQFHDKVPGIAMQAVSLTCGVLFIMLFVYATRIIRVTDKLRMGIVVATSALCLFYLVSMLLSFFGVGVPLALQRKQSMDRLQPVRGRPGGIQPVARLRLHRKGRRVAGPQVHGVVRRVRPDGHADLALSRDPPPADEARAARLRRS